ncbi:hypothetical protein ABT337_15980 [Saccharopolyspora hirsuta]|uniref:Uncharacterized protein n=1 Tax=Saccharopolyspora hirsuta TaxID=1837 RepID=A0A5M7C6R5_SACHI|nr:hypothetical protein [Saccharopolyspora hirsuta]KAA5837140.1 hypothetical protein F1721_04825 [Saccharopolyspora hirsuta]
MSLGDRELHRRVEELLAAAGLPADESEKRGLASAYRARLAAIESLHAMPVPREVGPRPHRHD